MLFGIVTVGLLAVLLWQKGWIPIEFGGVETGTLTTVDPTPEPLDDTDHSLDTEAIVVTGQTEPPFENEAGNADPIGAGSEQQFAIPGQTQWEPPADSTMPTQFPTAENTTIAEPNFASSPSNDSSAGIVQVGGAVPAEPETSQSTGFPMTPEVVAIDRLIEEGDHIAAHRQLSTIYWNHPELREATASRREKLAKMIYFQSDPHYMRPYAIQPGDQLVKIAKLYHVPWQYLAELNGIDNPARIRAGQKLKVIKGPFHAFVDVSERSLTVHAHGYFVRRYDIGVGKNKSTPIGRFEVLEKVAEPQYTDSRTGQVIAGGAADNPLGHHWIDLGNSYGIHGTIDDDSIGQAESRGCVRMHNSDVAQVYNLLTVGSEVVIRD